MFQIKMSKDKDKLKEEAISELMKETKRAAARAEVRTFF